MEAEIRRRVVKKIGYFLKPGGRLVLTLDLIPKTENLWNRDRGKIVEDVQTHGTLADFIKELEEEGVKITSNDIIGKLPGSATDIAFMIACKE